MIENLLINTNAENNNVVNYIILILLSTIIAKNHIKAYFQQILYIIQSFLKDPPKIGEDQELKKLM
jgi:hypothetical protein